LPKKYQKVSKKVKKYQKKYQRKVAKIRLFTNFELQVCVFLGLGTTYFG